MSDFEVIQELKNRVSALEEENELFKEFIHEIGTHFPDSSLPIREVVKKGKYKNIDWSFLKWLK